MDRRVFIVRGAALLSLGLVGASLNANDWSEEYAKACREAGVPMKERGEVCVLVVGGKVIRFEDVKKGDRFCAVFPRGYERHSDGKPVEWIADSDAEIVDGPERAYMTATEIKQRA